MKLFLCSAISHKGDFYNLKVAKTEEEAKNRYLKELLAEDIFHLGISCQEISEVDGYVIKISNKTSS